jgi:hypothetical protein
LTVASRVPERVSASPASVASRMIAIASSRPTSGEMTMNTAILVMPPVTSMPGPL